MLIDSVVNRTGGSIDSQEEVGGWGSLAPGAAAPDQGSDGTPDDWETRSGADPSSADNNGDLGGDGYTDVEEYVYWASRPNRPPA